MFDVMVALRELVEKGGSDLHLKGDQAAAARLDAVGNQPGFMTLQKG